LATAERNRLRTGKTFGASSSSYLVYGAVLGHLEKVGWIVTVYVFECMLFDQVRQYDLVVSLHYYAIAHRVGGIKQ